MTAKEMGSQIAHVIRRERFSAAHRLFRPDWTEEQNNEVYGKCANENWHGHNYELFVTVKGPIDPETGYTIDLKVLSNLIKEHVINHLDHKNINLDTPFMKGKLASTENLAVAIWDQLDAPIKSHGCTLHCVRVQETENNLVEYFG